jgi:hypothetical protein
MSNLPWGPHGPEAAPNTVRPNPTAPSPVPTFEQQDYSAPPMTGGGASGAGAIPAQIVTSVLIMALIWEAVVCLYPMTVIAAIAADLITAPMVNLVAPAEFKGDLGYLMGGLAALVAAGVMIRIEYRLAQNSGFRIGRHVVRMILLSMWVIPNLMILMGAGYPKSTTLFIYSVVTSPPTMISFLADPRDLAIWAAVMVGLHFLIWKWKGARQFWHNRLKWIGLK